MTPSSTPQTHHNATLIMIIRLSVGCVLLVLYDDRSMAASCRANSINEARFVLFMTTSYKHRRLTCLHNLTRRSRSRSPKLNHSFRFDFIRTFLFVLHVQYFLTRAKSVLILVLVLLLVLVPYCTHYLFLVPQHAPALSVAKLVLN